ncbi:MAG: hypothetical protein NTY01_16740 [Verrucomicrobia bacterium]|nr:hypothetical protein [Verrucomicrobiota bacterium]
MEPHAGREELDVEAASVSDGWTFGRHKRKRFVVLLAKRILTCKTTATYGNASGGVKRENGASGADSESRR